MLLRPRLAQFPRETIRGIGNNFSLAFFLLSSEKKKIAEYIYSALYDALAHTSGFMFRARSRAHSESAKKDKRGNKYGKHVSEKATHAMDPSQRSINNGSYSSHHERLARASCTLGITEHAQTWCVVCSVPCLRLIGTRVVLALHDDVLCFQCARKKSKQR